MTDHPRQLYAVEFTGADQARLAGFSCGGDTWARHVAEWIQGSDVLDSMNRGTKVWLFETAESEIVGFGSLGPARWRWPPPDGSPTVVLLIPMLGLDTRFQGQPPDPEWRFARQIMSHLVSEAKAMSRQAADEAGAPIVWLVLLVRRDNRRAIRFYEKCGFELIPGVVRRNDHLVMKLWIGEFEA
jgi:ribosomal protein S18 acetylase RimI-like enzyme